MAKVTASLGETTRPRAEIMVLAGVTVTTVELVIAATVVFVAVGAATGGAAGGTRIHINFPDIMNVPNICAARHSANGIANIRAIPQSCPWTIWRTVKGVASNSSL